MGVDPGMLGHAPEPTLISVSTQETRSGLSGFFLKKRT